MEIDPNGKDPKEGGAKLDAYKSPIFQGLFDYFPLACLEVAKVSAEGAKKYSWKGWETVPDGINRYQNALGRHMLLQSVEGEYDYDTGMLHKAQMAWNALATLELWLRQNKEQHALY